VIQADLDESQEKLTQKVQSDENLTKYFEKKKIERVIYVKNRLINFVLV